MLLALLAWVPNIWAGVKETTQAESLLRATLDNGMRVVIVQNRLAPVVATVVNYLVGSNEAPGEFPGMAHAQEHMMFRGSPGLSAAQLASLMAALGGRANADTQQTVTQYMFTVPAEELEVALHIEAIRMQDILDSETLWEKERDAIEQEVARDLSSPMYVFYARLLEKMFAGTPYAHDALGTRPSFQKTTGAMLKKFHEIWYAPNNAILVIAGDVDPEQTFCMVKRLFSGIPTRPLPPKPMIHLQPLKPRSIYLETDLPYGMTVVAYRMPGYDSPDFAAGQVLADILDSPRANLYALAAQGEALFAGFNTNILPQAGLGFALAGFPKREDGLPLIGAVKGIIAEYVKNGVPPDLVEASKRHEIVDAEFRKNSIEGLAAEWSQALAVEGRNSLDDGIEAIRKVTVSDVNRVVRKYLKNDIAIVGLLTPRTPGKPITSRGLMRGKESFVPEQTKPVSLPSWAEKALTPAGLPSSKVKPTVTILANGLRLIVQPETISRTISVYGRVKNSPDLEEPEGQEGVTEVLDGLFSYGTASLDRLAFQKAEDNIAANVEAGRSFSLHVLPDHFDRGVQLLSENLLHPALPETAFKIMKKETIGQLAGRLQSPSYLSKRALLEKLYPKGDPCLRQATPQTVGSLGLGDVKAYYKKIFRPDLTIIVVIGHVRPELAKETIEKYFGQWKATGPKPETVLPTVPLNRPGATLVRDASRVQAEVTLAETLGLTRSNPDYYSLQLGLHVLSGGFYATRLYRDLREKAGLVYTVEAFLEAHKTRSVFWVVYGCAPPNVSKARVLVVRNLQKMQKTPVTPAELKQARTLLIQQIPLSESSTESIAERLLGLSLEDLPLNEPIRAAKRYRVTTGEEVRAAFANWIRPHDLVQVTLGPEPE